MAKSEISEWMPVEIARFYSSPRVRNMRDFQRWWYMALLMEAWQSDPPCHLSADQEQLRMIAGANQADWDKHSNLVLGCFDAVEGTNLVVNRAQLEIYNEKMASRESQKAGGKKGAKARWDRHRLAMGNPYEAIRSSSLSGSAVVVDVGSKTSKLAEVREVRLDIEPVEIDGEAEFRKLLLVFPKPEDDCATMNAFHERVLRDAHTLRISQAEVLAKIHEAAELYRRMADEGMLDFVYPLNAWLRKGVCNQNPEMWKGKSNGRASNNTGQPGGASATELIRTRLANTGAPRPEPNAPHDGLLPRGQTQRRH